MIQRVDGQHGHTSHLADRALQDERSEQDLEQHSVARFKVQRAKVLRAKILRNKMAAAFWKGKSIKGREKIPSPSAQKLAKLGHRPRPGAYGKRRTGARSEDGTHAPKDEHEHNDERQHGDDRHDERHERERNDQEHYPQQQGQNDGQSRQRDSGDRQQPESRDKREKRSRPYAIKAGKLNAVCVRTLPGPMQILAKDKLGSLDLADRLVDEGTKAAIGLMSNIKHDGPLLLVPYLLSMASPLRLVRSRQPARLHSHRNASLAQRAVVAGGTHITAQLQELSLDNTLARLRAGVDYNDDEQSISAIKQHILDASGSAPALQRAPVSGTPVVSDKTVEVRTPPATPGFKT